MEATRILIVDDHHLFRQSLALMLSSQADMKVIAEASDGAEAVDMATRMRPDLALIDISMPGMPSFEAARLIKQQQPAVKVLFVSMHDDEDYLVESLAMGANGYILKDTEVPQFVAAIRDVVRGGNYLSPRMLGRLMDDIKINPKTGAMKSRSDVLSGRERQVLKILAEGKSVKEIAAEFRLSVKTVEAHKFNMMRKLGIHNKAQLVHYAVAKKIVKLP